jgi:hypothetical protein
MRLNDKMAYTDIRIQMFYLVWKPEVKYFTCKLHPGITRNGMATLFLLSKFVSALLLNFQKMFNTGYFCFNKSIPHRKNSPVMPDEITVNEGK